MASETLRWSVSFHNGERWVCFASFGGTRAPDAEGAITYALNAAPLVARTSRLMVAQYVAGATSKTISYHPPRQAVAA